MQRGQVEPAAGAAEEGADPPGGVHLQAAAGASDARGRRAADGEAPAPVFTHSQACEMCPSKIVYMVLSSHCTAARSARSTHCMAGPLKQSSGINKSCS